MRSRVIRPAVAASAILALGATAQAREAQQTPYPTLAAGQSGDAQARPQARPRQQDQQRSQANQQLREQMQSPPPEITGQKPVRMVLVASADQILSNPSLYYGIPVSVHAAVGERLGPKVFTLDEDDWLDANWFGHDLMVVNPRPARTTARTASEDDETYVTVVGTLRPFIRTDLERDYDWFDTVPDYDLELDERPVIIADSIRTSTGTQLVQNPPADTMLLVTTAGRIAELPGRYYGRNVSVRAEVEDVVSRRLFTLDEDRLFAGPDVLVLNPFPAVAPGDDEIVTVVGTVRPFVASDFERDYDWFDAADFGADLEQYERRPVIVAHSILGQRQWVVLPPELTLDRSEAMMNRRMEEQRRARAGQPAGSMGQSGRSAQGEAGTAGGETGRPAATAGTSGEEMILDLSSLTNVSDPSGIVQRQVDLPEVRIQRIVNERTIWVGPSADRRVLVIIPEGTPTPSALTEGQRVRVQGTVVGAEAVPRDVQARYAIRARQIG